MDVSSLKQQATALEQQGKAAEAAALYLQVLDELEGTPGIKRELPLYAKAGDALLKSGDPNGAIEMYRRAADHYAEHGSAKSILVLCMRVLRADRKQTDVFIRFAQALLDHGHIEASRTVLVDYATRAKLEKTRERLEKLADLPEEEARQHLEQLLAKAHRARKPAAEEQAAEEEAVEEEAVEEEVVEQEAAEEEPAEEEAAEEVMVPERVAPESVVAEPATPGSDLPLIPLGEDEPPPRGEYVPEPRGERAAPAPLAEPKRGRDVLMSERREQPRKKKPAWILPAAAAAVVVVVGGGLAVLMTRGGGDAEEAPEILVVPESTMTATSDTGALSEDSAAMLAGLGDSTVVDSLGVPIAAVDSLGGDTAAGDTTGAALPAAQDTLAGQAVAPPQTEIDSVADSALAVPPLPVAIADSGVLVPPSQLPPGTTVEGPVLAIEGLEIESVDQLAATGGGYRVVQRLVTGERLELTVTPLGQAQVAGAGALRVITLPGDTAMGTVRFGDNLISARALVAADVLEGLLRRIVVLR